MPLFFVIVFFVLLSESMMQKVQQVFGSGFQKHVRRAQWFYLTVKLGWVCDDWNVEFVVVDASMGGFCVVVPQEWCWWDKARACSVT